MRVFLINQFFPPASAPTGRLLRDLAAAIAKRGANVTVLTSGAQYGAHATSLSDPSGVMVERLIHRVGVRGGLLRKCADYLAFYKAVSQALRASLQSGDAVLAMTTPPFIGVTCARIARARGARCVLWCMDLYPEALRAAGWMRCANPLYRFLERFARFERSAADLCIALSDDMADRLRASDAKRVEVVPVWADPVFEAAPPLSISGQGPLRLLYSGNMGRAHREDEFFEIARSLKASGVTFEMTFQGHGPQQRDWERAAPESVTFKPPVSSDRVASSLAAADVHLVSQQPGWEGVVAPSKFQTACALGKPVLFAGPLDCDVSRAIRASGAGWVVPPGDRSACAIAARDMAVPERRAQAGAGARALYLERFHSEACIARLCRLVL